MKLIAPIIFAATASAFDIDMEHEDQLIRVKRQSLRDIIANNFGERQEVSATEAPAADGEFECVLRELNGFHFYYSDIDNEEDCRAEKNLIFEVECESELCGDDAAWPCTHDGVQACIQAQFLAGRNGGRKLGVRYTRWKAVAKIIAHQVAKPTLTKKDIIKKMLNYGCHCFPGSKKNRSVGGKGPAMDEIDGICRSQYQCHKCVEMDHGCNPDETPYKVQFKGKKDKDKLAGKDIICRDEEGTCGRAMCECDKRMAENLDKVWFQNLHNTYYWLDKKNVKKAKKGETEVFDYENVCFTGVNSPQPDQCCGDFPDVVPYNTGSKECCVTDGPKLINPMTHTCCAGGIIAQAGSC